jgi:hypothetical protein
MAKMNSKEWKIIRGMQGSSGFPAGEYKRELEKNEKGDLRIHMIDQDWIDHWDVEKQEFIYDEKIIDKYEKISQEEADSLFWDWEIE